jgi:hypothetical protein
MIPVGGKDFGGLKDANNWVEGTAIKYQKSNKWWGKVNFKAINWPKFRKTKEQWADGYLMR